ncbi:hypothetical protein CVD28_18865 [Bacillus sp. M6-12]|uniref:FTR1 family iron permease n=1 Tax=Bacillus sp. M6-12 TaxID=2054166 RepID=UPI000C768447|nr:FTR1 family protein [Bacillus sp. M6-12]PLS16103.1 hypothetical protein CVD28_18865 [Bacillus sp. M6-12]
MIALKKAKVLLCLLLAILFLTLNISSANAAADQDELFVLIGDSLMKAKSGDINSVSANLDEFETVWTTIKKPNSKQAINVDKNLAQLKTELKKGKGDQEQIKTLLSQLSSSVVAYDEEQNPVDKEQEKTKIKGLLPYVDQMKEAILAEDAKKAMQQYPVLLNKWTAVEKIVRNQSVVSYGEIEKNMAFIRIALTQEPADLQKAKEGIVALQTSINNLLAGKVKASAVTDVSLKDVTALLSKSEKHIASGQNEEASKKLNEILTIWPMVEGEVQTRDSKLYSDVETQVPAAISLLESKKVKTSEANKIIQDLKNRLSQVLEDTSYSIWDAALILLREGLEGLLIVATLVSFLKKVNQADKQRWIWIGVGAGVIASAILALVINLVFSQLTASSSREYIEGYTGIVAVIMMLTVGAWLHSKANIGSWNRYINQQMGQALAKGSLYSFAFIAFLSIFREGAETIIFYTGMAPYMSLNRLAIGIAVAVAILVAAGYILIRYSPKIPIHLFFTTATILIYFLSFKILGISIHSLQVSQILATHTIHPFPFIEWIGLYPTWETLIAQVLLLAIVFILSAWIKLRNSKFTKEVPV